MEVGTALGKNTAVTYASMLLAAVFWGLSFIWTSMVLRYLPPVTTIVFRLAVSIVFLYAFGIATRRLIRIRRPDLKYFLLLAACEPFVYFLGENFALTYVSSTVASVVISLIPLFTPFAARFFLNERIGVKNILGILISITGVVLVLLKHDLSISVSPEGLALLLLAVAAAVGYSIAIMKVVSRYPIFTIVTVQNTIGLIFFMPVFLLLDSDKLGHIVWSGKWIYPLLQLALLASSVAFIFFAESIKRLGVTRANALTNVIPVFTAIFASVLLGETLLPVNLIGIIIVVGGLFLSQIRK